MRSFLTHHVLRDDASTAIMLGGIAEERLLSCAIATLAVLWNFLAVKKWWIWRRRWTTAGLLYYDSMDHVAPNMVDPIYVDLNRRALQFVFDPLCTSSKHHHILNTRPLCVGDQCLAAD